MKNINIDTIIALLKKHELFKLVSWKGKYNYGDIPNEQFYHLTYNSNDVQKDSLFFCKGELFKPEYLIEATKSGAKVYISEKNYHSNSQIKDSIGIIVTDIQKAMAVISMEFYGYPQDKLKIYCFTGTKGKTTSAYFAKHILNHLYGNNRVAMYTTMQNSIDGLNFTKSYNSTPESLDLYKMMNESLSKGITHLVMEASSQGYKKNRLYNLMYDVGIFLNITPDHISPVEHPDFEDYLSCKLQLIHNSKKVIVNRDCAAYNIIEEICQNTNKEFVEFSHTDINSEYYLNINKDYSFSIIDNVKKISMNHLKISLLGEFNIFNAFAAIVLAQLTSNAELDYKDIIKGIKIPGRMEKVSSASKNIYVDYAHNYISLKSLLKLVKEYHSNSKIKVLIGSTGNKAESRRKDFGELLNIYADYVYLSTDDPDFESPYKICEEIKSYIVNKNKVEIILDREVAIIEAINNLSNEDVLVIAGKGADPYQKINGNYEKYLGDYVIAQNACDRLS